MSRSGYSDDLTNWALIKWRGQVTSATRGARGQAMLRELLEALDAMPVKRLASGSFSDSGEFCTLGVLGAKRGLDMSALNVAAEAEELDGRDVASIFGVARALACEVMFENDKAGYWAETPEARWSRMRSWVQSQITKDAA